MSTEINIELNTRVWIADTDALEVVECRCYAIEAQKFLTEDGTWLDGPRLPQYFFQDDQLRHRGQSCYLGNCIYSTRDEAVAYLVRYLNQRIEEAEERVHVLHTKLAEVLA